MRYVLALLFLVLTLPCRADPMSVDDVLRLPSEQRPQTLEQALQMGLLARQRDGRLEYRNGAWRLAREMVKPAPSWPALARQADQLWRNAEPDDEPLWGYAHFWGRMLDLIYSGHADLAWRFYQHGWHGKHKAAFLASFKSQLTKSAYYRYVKQLDGASVP